ncbi:MAG: hypothetical protein GY782_07020 [Gammaproteobacteria bacterium]|nr:hypothetical protein [Gammaproteobacteria bacterium]
MIKITMPELEITNEDNEAISSLLKATLKAEHGYDGLVVVNEKKLYELKGEESRQIARMWIRICQSNSKY